MNVTLKNNGFWDFKDAICFVKSANFGIFFGADNNYKNTFVLGIGGNMGDTRARFERFLRVLRHDKRFFVSQSSVILKNKPFGFLKQNDFLNAVLIVQTSLFPQAVLKLLNHFEKIFGRKRSFKNAPRTLDLDILYFDKKVRKSARLILPHSGVNDRASVILPFGSLRS